MPAIAIVAYTALSTAGWAGVTGAMLFSAVVEAVAIASSYLAYQSMKGKRRGLDGGGTMVNTRSSEEPLPVLYGRHRIGGNQVYVNATGENNKYLHIVMSLSEGPIEGIETIYLDDKPASDYGSLVYYEFFNGAGDQGLCTTLDAADANWDDYMRWTAYLYIRLTYNADKFTGMPKITVITKGRKLYDPRSGLTAYSNNPALVVYDFLTSKRYGLGIPAADVDDASFMDAANWYEAQPDPYTFNGLVVDRQAFLDNITDILVNCRADIIWGDGKYKLLVRKYDTPVMSFNEDEIVADSFTFSVPGLADTPNRIIVKYPDEQSADPDDLGWTPKDQVIEDTDSVLLYDNEERDIDLQLIGTTNAEQANLLGIYNLERARLNKTFSFVVHPRALALEPGDMVQVTHTLPGWTDAPVRVMDIRISQDGLVALMVQEEDAALYDDTLNLSPHTYFKTNLPNPLDPVGEATGVSFAEEEYFNKDVSYTRLKVSFTNPSSPFWDYSEVWVNVNGAGYNHYTDAHGSFTIEPVKEAVNYKVKLLSVSIQGVRQDISTATEWSYDVIGKNSLPDDVQNFRVIPQSDTVILMWDAVNIVDLQGYEIRKGTNWNGGIFLGFTRAVTFQLNGVAPGTHSYMIKSLDTNGKYSNGYALASATVYGPASYSETMSELNEFQTPSAWAASTAYASGNKVSPTTANGFYYKATAGTSGGTEPTWPTTNGGTVADGGVTWTAYEDQVFTDMEAYDDPVSGWEIYVVHDSDEFGTATEQNLKTGGDGAKRHGWNVLNSANADAIDINISNSDMLAIDCNAVLSAEGTTFLAPFVYKNIVGDFDIETKIVSSTFNENYEKASLIARDPEASANEDFISITNVFSTQQYVMTRNMVNGVNNDTYPYTGVNYYLRMTRAGQVFTVYSKATEGAAWTQRGQFDRTSASPFANTIQVGLALSTGNTNNNYVNQFEYFRKVGGSLSGSYVSPVYDRGSTLTRRSWPDFDYAFEGTGSAWADQFGATDLWTDVFGADDTWLHLFGAYQAGTVKMKLGVSTNGTSWTWYQNFESYVIEAQGKFIKYSIDITDQEAAGYLHAGAITLKEAYWGI